MTKFLFLCLIFTATSVSLIGKTTHIIKIEPSYNGSALSEADLDFLKITLFTANRRDSIILDRYNNCYELKGKHQRFNGGYIWMNKSIPFRELRVQHPKFLSSFQRLNITTTEIDSVDEFNKRHHILFHVTKVELEVECEENLSYDFHFWNSGKPTGGRYYPQHLGILLKDTLNKNQLADFETRHKIKIIDKSKENKFLFVKLLKGKASFSKNKTLKSILVDSFLVKDAGVLIDTNCYTFISSFAKISSLPITEINKLDYKPITALKSLAMEFNYIKAKELEWGCGLYLNRTGFAYNLIELQAKIIQEQDEQHCKDQEELLALDLEYLELSTVNYSNSGGKDIGRKRNNNTERMIEINDREKEIKKRYEAFKGKIDLILVSEI